MNDWISIEDKMPENNSEVLIYIEDYGILLAHYNYMPYKRYGFWSEGGGFEYEEQWFPKYWMPLPNPPKEN